MNSVCVPRKYPNVLVHCVFSTKARRNLIPLQMLPKLWRYFGGIARNHKLGLLAAGGTPNHCHLLLALPSDMTLAKAIQVVKANSSRWIREHGIAFTWQEGYGAFSVSSSSKAAVIDYIEHQAEHHCRRNFEAEFEVIIRRSGMPFDAAEAFGE